MLFLIEAINLNVWKGALPDCHSSNRLGKVKIRVRPWAAIQNCLNRHLITIMQLISRYIKWIINRYWTSFAGLKTQSVRKRKRTFKIQWHFKNWKLKTNPLRLMVQNKSPSGSARSRRSSFPINLLQRFEGGLPVPIQASIPQPNYPCFNMGIKSIINFVI